MVRPTNKGRGIVVFVKRDYESEMLKILGDQDTYCALSYDPTNRFKRESDTIIKQGFGGSILNKEENAYLVPLATLIFLPLPP